MAAPSRTSLFSKVHKVLKKHYQVVPPDLNRSVFEQLVFASCLENAHYDRAEEAFAALVHNFFDWNEVRVSTVRELSEVMACLPEPPAAANRIKRVLQSVFESLYSFDLDDLHKQNLGPAVEHLKKLDGTTNFSVAYVTQTALGGHAIPVDAGALRALWVVNLVSEEDVRAGVVPGLDRAIAKTKGLEFASLLHQLSADFIANRYAPALHKTLLDIDPSARERLPKRRSRKRAGASTLGEEGNAQAQETSAKSRKRARADAKEDTSKRTTKRSGSKGKSAAEKATQSKPEASPPQRTTPQEKDPSAEEQPGPGTKKKRPASSKRSTANKDPDPGKAKLRRDAAGKKSASAGLSKRKPR